MPLILLVGNGVDVDLRRLVQTDAGDLGLAYIGFDQVSTAAEEVRDPQRTMPQGIIYSLLICTVLYIAVVAVLTGMVPYQKLSVDAGVSDAFKQRGLPWAEMIVASAGVAGPAAMGKVMGALKPQLAGRADMTQVAARVKTRLAPS